MRGMSTARSRGSLTLQFQLPDNWSAMVSSQYPAAAIDELGLIMLTIRHRWRGGSSSYTAINGSSSRGSFVDSVDIAHGDKRSFADIATLQLAPLLWPINCASASVWRLCLDPGLTPIIIYRRSPVPSLTPHRRRCNT